MSILRRRKKFDWDPPPDLVWILAMIFMAIMVMTVFGCTSVVVVGEGCAVSRDGAVFAGVGLGKSLEAQCNANEIGTKPPQGEEAGKASYWYRSEEAWPEEEVPAHRGRETARQASTAAKGSAAHHGSTGVNDYAKGIW